MDVAAAPRPRTGESGTTDRAVAPTISGRPAGCASRRVAGFAARLGDRLGGRHPRGTPRRHRAETHDQASSSTAATAGQRAEGQRQCGREHPGRASRPPEPCRPADSRAPHRARAPRPRRSVAWAAASRRICRGVAPTARIRARSRRWPASDTASAPPTTNPMTSRMIPASEPASRSSRERARPLPGDTRSPRFAPVTGQPGAPQLRRGPRRRPFRRRPARCGARSGRRSGGERAAVRGRQPDRRPVGEPQTGPAARRPRPATR